MRIFFTWVVLMMVYPVCSQDMASDIDLIWAGSHEQYADEEVEFKGLLKVYHNLISDQIINDCIYEHSCSTFSQGAISSYGLIKGGVMSVERLMRCNRASGLDFVPSYFNDEGQVKDHWSDYRH